MFVEEEKYVDDPESTRVRNLFMAYMQKFQLTQAILCKYIGVSQSVLSQWTRGKYNGANLTVTEKVRQFIDTHQDGPGQMPPQEPKKKSALCIPPLLHSCSHHSLQRWCLWRCRPLLARPVALRRRAKGRCRNGGESSWMCVCVKSIRR